jgi:glucokinase
MNEGGGRVLAFDVGGTRVKAGIVDSDSGNVEHFLTGPSGAALADALATVKELGSDLVERGKCAQCAICLPGLISEEGDVIDIPGKLLGAAGTDVKGFAASAFGLPVRVIHDSVAHGAGEATFGAGVGARRVLVSTIGTGVGVTIFQDGRPTGPPPFGAGALGGHIPISERTSGRPDSNGTYDTIEALCMADRIVDYVNDAGGNVSDAAGAFAAHRSGDAAAVAGTAVYRGHLVRALVALAHAHGPEVIVLGGGPMVAGNPVVDGVEDGVNARLFGTYRVKVRLAALGDRAALAGLAALTRAGAA